MNLLQLWRELRELWNLRVYGWQAPPVYRETDRHVPRYEWREGKIQPVKTTPEEPKWIILYRGVPFSWARPEVAAVLRKLRSGEVNEFQANAALYDVAVRSGQPILFWATTYEKYSGPLLDWND